MPSNLESVAVGRRFACCRNTYSPREDLEKVVWETGIIRAATELDIKHDDQQFCVEWDGKDPVRDYQWIYLHHTLEEDRYENVEGGDFNLFLIEDKIIWCEVDGLTNGNGNKNNKQHSHKNFKPVSTFIPLLDDMYFESRSRVPVYLLVENRLIFVDRDQTNSYPVQQHQTSLTIKGLSIPVSKEHQLAINQWFDTRRTQQRIIAEKDKRLVGQSVQVYWKDGANHRWYAACLKEFNKDNTVIVMDYNVIQDRKVDPRLEEIRIVKDQGRSTQASTSISPTPTELSDTGRRSRRTTTKQKSQERVVKEEPPSPKPAAKKRGPKKSQPVAAGEKRKRGRPPKNAAPRKKKPASSEEDEEDESEESEEELPLQAAAQNDAESDNDEEPSWSLSKFAARQQKASSPPPPPPSKRKQPASKAALPPAKKRGRPKDSDIDDSSSMSEDARSEHSFSDNSDTSAEPPKKKTAAVNKAGKPKGKPGRKPGSKNKPKEEKKEKSAVKSPARSRKKPVSYRESSDDEEADLKSEPAVRSPTPPPVVVPKPAAKKTEKVKKSKNVEEKSKNIEEKSKNVEEKVQPMPKDESVKKKGSGENRPVDPGPEPKVEKISKESRVQKTEEKPSAPIPVEKSPNSLIAALTMPSSQNLLNGASANWAQTSSKPAAVAVPLQQTETQSMQKKMARVAGQPQPAPSESFPREPPAEISRPEFHPVHNAPPPERSAPAPPVVIPSQPQPAPPAGHPIPGPQNDFYQQARYQNTYGHPYPPFSNPQSMPSAPSSQPNNMQSRQPQPSSPIGNSVFRANTPSPFVPRNSPVSNPQQQQQQGGHQTATTPAAQSQYRPAMSASPYPSQNQQPFGAGPMMPPYGSPAFFYQNAMGGPAGFASGPGGLIYGPGNGGMVPMYPVLAQGGQWDAAAAGMLYNMVPGLHQGQITPEQYARMAAAAAQAAVGNRNSSVRSTATSPDLRQHSTSHLTGVISGAMQALNNFPSPPLPTSTTQFHPGQKTTHPSAPAQSLSSKAMHDHSSAKDRPSSKDNARPPSSHSHSSHLSGHGHTPRSSPHLPMRTEPQSDSVRSHESKTAPTKPEKEKRSKKKPTSSTPQPLVLQQPFPSQPIAISSEPCPLAMLSAVATAMKPVDTATVTMSQISRPQVLPSAFASMPVAVEMQPTHTVVTASETPLETKVVKPATPPVEPSREVVASVPAQVEKSRSPSPKVEERSSVPREDVDTSQKDHPVLAQPETGEEVTEPVSDKGMEVSSSGKITPPPNAPIHTAENKARVEESPEPLVTAEVGDEKKEASEQVLVVESQEKSSAVTEVPTETDAVKPAEQQERSGVNDEESSVRPSALDADAMNAANSTVENPEKGISEAGSSVSLSAAPTTSSIVSYADSDDEEDNPRLKICEESSALVSDGSSPTKQSPEENV